MISAIFSLKYSCSSFFKSSLKTVESFGRTSTGTFLLPFSIFESVDWSMSNAAASFVKVRAGGAGQPLAGKRRGLPRSALFLKIGSSVVVKFHQE